MYDNLNVSVCIFCSNTRVASTPQPISQILPYSTLDPSSNLRVNYSQKPNPSISINLPLTVYLPQQFLGDVAKKFQ